MCDNSKQAVDIIKKNITKTHMDLEKIELYQTDFENLLKTKIKEKPNIIFIDPPYKTDYAYKAVKIMLQENLIDENTNIIIETDEENKVLQQIKDMDIELKCIKKYGRAYLIFLRQKRKG